MVGREDVPSRGCQACTFPRERHGGAVVAGLGRVRVECHPMAARSAPYRGIRPSGGAAWYRATAR